MSEWLYFIHPPREDFAETMTAAEEEVWERRFERLKRMLAAGTLVLAGPTLGPVNTGITIFEAPDRAAAEAVMADDPVVAEGFARGELREFRVSLLRGRWSLLPARRPLPTSCLLPPSSVSRLASASRLRLPPPASRLASRLLPPAACSLPGEW